MKDAYYQKLTKEIWKNKKQLQKFIGYDMFQDECKGMKSYISGLEQAREWFRLSKKKAKS